ncbi:hypothetical protein B0G77_6253 [Paraburkholderia sp. BL10I2N1]|nr:hypothetical protein B0G77_6253 [Paraburkholderia sp. BL10I2N1]
MATVDANATLIVIDMQTGIQHPKLGRRTNPHNRAGPRRGCHGAIAPQHQRGSQMAVFPANSSRRNDVNARIVLERCRCCG